MVERCARCNVEGQDVRLFDAIYEGRMGNLCERCSIIENIPIIKKPDAAQLRDSEKGVGVYSRMKRLSGIRDSNKSDTFFVEDRLNELNENPNLEVPEKDQLNLIEHFHWVIMKNRRRKGLSQKQLADTLGESEAVVQMIEKAKLPENAEQLIRKLEQFFQVKLKKINETERFFQKQREEPMLLDEQGRELMEIPEPEINNEVALEETSNEDSVDEFLDNAEKNSKSVKEETEIEEFGGHEIQQLDENKDYDLDLNEEEKELRGIDKEKAEFDITNANLNEIKISDLKELHRKKIEVTRQEQNEEAKKIEERQRLIEARKEELRMMKEKESGELDNILGGTELLGIGESPKRLEDSGEVDEFEKELV